MAIVVRMPSTIEEAAELFRAVDADNPTAEDMRAFRAALEKYPELWLVVGDMLANAASNFIDSFEAPKSVKMSMEHGWEAKQKELGVDEATPLEKLLIQQVVLSWMRIGHVELKYTDVIHGSSATYERLNYRERRLNAAQRRFLRASETLARIRKMDLPAVQVNIAEQQVNVAGK